MILERCHPKSQLCAHIELAESFRQRLIGLIGTKKMQDYGMYFQDCNWIHTFFMSQAIDVIYLDKKMKIKKIDHALKPWRLGMPVLSASSVIEVEAGLANKYQLQIGEELHVGH